jgi:hypothetical protein
MIRSRRNWIKPQPAIGYATAENFCRIFAEGMNDLYQLSFLLTADHEKAERCFVMGLEESITSNRVFKEWAHSWAKRTVIQNAIRELKPRPPIAALPSSAVSPYIGQLMSG